MQLTRLITLHQGTIEGTIVGHDVATEKLAILTQSGIRYVLDEEIVRSEQFNTRDADER